MLHKCNYDYKFNCDSFYFLNKEIIISCKFFLLFNKKTLLLQMIYKFAWIKFEAEATFQFPSYVYIKIAKN